MARIAGIDLPKNKRGIIGLTYIFGIGHSTAVYILDKAGIDHNVKVQDWDDDQLTKIRTIINEEIKVEGLNGQEVKSRLFSSNHNYSVQPGENVLSVRYVQFFEEHPGIGSHDIVRSGIVHIKTPVLQDKATYRLGLVNPPKTHDDAKEFAKQPVFGLFDARNQLLVQQAGAKDLNRGILQNLFSTSSTESAQAAPVSVTQPAAVYSPQAVVTTKPVATVSNVAGADQQLIQLWQQASKTERQKFMSWLAEQAN